MGKAAPPPPCKPNGYPWLQYSSCVPRSSWFCTRSFSELRTPAQEGRSCLRLRCLEPSHSQKLSEKLTLMYLNHNVCRETLPSDVWPLNTLRLALTLLYPAANTARRLCMSLVLICWQKLAWPLMSQAPMYGLSNTLRLALTLYPASNTARRLCMSLVLMSASPHC